MSIITFDVETYYDRDYSLSKMTTESYIRDPRFETIGFSIKVESGPSVWFSGDYDTLKRKLDQFELHKHIVIAHNAAFDCAILNWRFGIKPRFIIDTMSMARPEHGLTTGLSLAKLAAHYELGVKGTEVVAALGMRRGDFSHQQLYEYGQYCCNDVDLTYDAFRRLAVRFPRQELEIIDMMIRMFTEPVLTLDGDVLQSHLDAVIANKERLMATIEVGTADIMSNDKFAAALESYGVVPPTKISPKTGKLAYAFAKTDSDFKDLLEHEDERVQALVAARLGLKSTLEETRTQAFLGIKERGTLPIMLNYYGAHTGRACLTGDTEITVLRGGCATSILLETLEPDDLVWDGEAFVAHGGLVDQGFKEIMDYQGVTGTFDHRVYVDEINEAVELREASQRGYTLCAMEPPAGYAYDVANTSGSCEE